jgi:hypothetical protein
LTAFFQRLKGTAAASFKQVKQGQFCKGVNGAVAENGIVQLKLRIPMPDLDSCVQRVDLFDDLVKLLKRCRYIV